MVTLRLKAGLALLGSLSLASPPAAHAVAAGVTCSLATVASPGTAGQRPTVQTGVVAGGPIAVAEIATGVDYQCAIVVVRPDGTASYTYRVFGVAGVVGVMPPLPVEFRADPGTDRVLVCTYVEYLWAFPSGGSYDFGCRQATHQPATGGYVLAPGAGTA